MCRFFVACLLVGIGRAACAADVGIENADFARWADGAPEGWKVEIGAANGQGPSSTLEPLEGGGVALTGDAQTAQWRLLSQAVALEPGKSYQLTFEARAVDVRREGPQFDNCYVGAALDTAAPRPKFVVATIDSSEWSPMRLAIDTPADLKAARLAIFLSKTGSLEVRDLKLAELSPGSSFQILVDDMDRHYSFFEAKKDLDWAALVEKHRQAAEAAGSPEAFARVVGRMLGALEDLHVTIRVGEGNLIPTHRRKYTANYDLPAVIKSLRDVERFEPAGLVGRTRDGFGYAAIGSLAGEEEVSKKLLEAIAKLRATPAVLIDLRPCTGGDERRAQAIARMFNDEPRVYARSLRRSGAKHTDLVEQPPRTLEAAIDEPYTRPVIVLIGPACVSSGEGFAQMMAALPHATLVGQPTGGASGNPAPIELPNGVTVWYSRWVSLLPDGAPLEGRGVPPDVVVEHKKERGRDVTFEAAVAEAKKRAK